MLKFRYQETTGMKKLLIELEALRIIFDTIKPISKIEENIRRESLLKSSLFSARIEGNPLTLTQAKHISPHREETDITKKEIFNLLRAYHSIYSQTSPKKISKKIILKLHEFVLKGISAEAGRLRQEQSAIFNQAGVAVYMPPAFFKLPELMTNYVDIINTLEYSAPVNAGIAHFLIEKIHPFLDGNGRVGRLISAFVEF